MLVLSIADKRATALLQRTSVPLSSFLELHSIHRELAWFVHIYPWPLTVSHCVRLEALPPCFLSRFDEIVIFSSESENLTDQSGHRNWGEHPQNIPRCVSLSLLWGLQPHKLGRNLFKILPASHQKVQRRNSQFERAWELSFYSLSVAYWHGWGREQFYV